ncbi:hypothetical protein [Marinobacter sp.]|uniref:hypothetical protein n=1 Tax=Marinobacter sp. TaxID=50741 RepID=UPI003A948BEF
MNRCNSNKSLRQVIFIRSATIIMLSVGSVTLADNELIFDADFDNQADWRNTESRQKLPYPSYSTKAEANLPGNFDSYYTSEKWYPNGSYTAGSITGPHPVGQISGVQSRRPGGKSLLVYDESYGGNSRWGSEAQLGKDFQENYQVLWVEFYIKFQRDYVLHDQLRKGSSQSIMKVFRARHVPENYKGKNRYDFFGTGGRAKSPVYMLDFKSWTVRSNNFSVARLTPFIRGYTPQELIGSDENYFLKNYEKETSIKQGGGDSLSFAEVFQTGEWVKINILIKMDSAPGAGDGVEEVWINDILEKARYDIPFRRAGEGEGVGFNWFSIGGNSHNIPYPEEDHYEQWFAITDLKIYGGKPDISKRLNVE